MATERTTPASRTLTPNKEGEITALQTRLAHQEHQLDELSDVVAAQAKIIDQLTRDLRILAERQRDLADTAFAQHQSDKPPPHY